MFIFSAANEGKKQFTIFKSAVEVANRLAERGTSRDLMMAVLDAMVAAKNECTENDPFGSRGWRAWQMGTRRNREVHVVDEVAPKPGRPKTYKKQPEQISN